MTPTADKHRRFKFAPDDRGQTMILFALMAVPLLGMAATAIDVSRAYRARNELQSAVDSAAAAGAKLLGQPHEQIGEMVLAFLKGNLQSQKEKSPVYDVVIAPNDTSITVRMQGSTPTTIAKIIGFKSLDYKVEATIERPAPVLATKTDGDETDDHSSTSDNRPPLNRGPTAREIHEAQIKARKIMEQLEQQAREQDVQEIIRMLGGL